LLAGPALAQDPSAPPPTEAHYATARALIADRQKIVTPNGIQVLEQVTLNGLPQWVSIRGTDKANPVIIYVHGGPGATEMGRSWPYQQGWEDYFTVVQWDQPGAGKTLRSGGEAANRAHLSRARMTSDLLALIDGALRPALPALSRGSIGAHGPTCPRPFRPPPEAPT
jgi:pimeloyl-ACP methyl ester carboxylesterase